MKSLRYACLLGLLSLVAQTAAVAQNGNAELYSHSRTASLDSGVAPLAKQIPDPDESKFPLLKPRSVEPQHNPETPVDGERSQKLTGPAITVISSLAVVLGLFAALVWAIRKWGSGATHKRFLPQEFIQTLGSTPIDVRTRVTMLRCGNRILVVAQSPSTMQTLCEITDPEEVRQITAACLGNSKQDFAAALQAIEKEPTSHGFVESASHQPSSGNRRRLFASV